MCSVGDDNIEEEGGTKFMIKNEKLKLRDATCNKCREEKAVVLLRGKDVYCKNCFLSGVTHKFKAFLGKHRFVYPNDKVLVLHNTGHASTAILNFLRSGLDLSTPKKLKFEPLFVFIEDRHDLSVGERREILQKVKKEVEGFQFPLYYIGLADYLKNGEDVSKSLRTNFEDLPLMENDGKQLSRFVNEKANLTIQNDVRNILERNILINVAKALDCKVVFTTDLAIDLASHLLTSISLGRGNHISLDVGVCDDRDQEVKIVRPLRVFDVKELAYYNRYNALDPVVVPQKKLNPYGSVQSLMKKFVEDLQVNYPATITTIVKTGDKLALDKNMASNEKCNLCKGPKCNTNDELSSAESTRFSHWVSTQTPNYNVTGVERYNNTLESFQNCEDENYCFGCSRISHFTNKA